MKKRGNVALWFLVEFIAAFLVVYMAASVSEANAGQTIYEKLNLAKDLSMQINTLASISGDAYIINKNLHGYSVSFSNSKIEVFENNFDQAKGIYYFVNTGKSKLDLKLNKPKQVIMSKIGDEIKVSEEMPKLN